MLKETSRKGDEREPTILITCLAPDRADFYPKVLTLFKTIKAFGGKIASSHLVANFEQHVNPHIDQQLKTLGVETRLVDPFDSSLKYSNKLRMLDTEGDYDVLMALDCDIAVIRDFSSQISPNFFQAKPVDQDPLLIEDWKSTFSYFGLDLPSERYRTSFYPKETIPYFNSGVLSIPRMYIRDLRESWARYVKDLWKARTSLSQKVSEYLSIYLDQMALALALASEKIPMRPFPLEMNFPTHHPIDPLLLPDNMKPFILHYHQKTGRGFSSNLVRKGLLMKTGYKMPDQAVKKVNDLLKHSQVVLNLCF